ncbi:MAG TPA: ParA family protein [Geobacteraceae bacterium]
MTQYPYVVTISSEKGGVGKTTVATNLAIFLKALHEDLPVSILSFDNHFTIDKMFEIKGQPITGNVADFLRGTPGGDLLHTGQYGVSYIPSSRSLAELKHAFAGPLVLAGLLASSRIPGILIIDTRPDLDVLTQNALFAADRVIIPVKDMASLENCRNIFDLFDKKGFDKKSLTLIPCLIDSRIKFDGPFRDQRSLLKAYAINRGFRCLDTYISKSPKVESLGTNPSGKVLPILTYARSTEVYGQFTQLARNVLEESGATAAPRSLLYQQWLQTEKARNDASYAARREGLRQDCLFCKRPLLSEAPDTVGYYFESSDGAACGFLEDECFSDLLFTSIFNFGKEVPPDDPKRIMFRDVTRDCSFVFRPVSNGGGTMIEFSRFDGEGMQLLKKLYPLREHEGGILNRERSGLFTLVTETLAGHDGKPRDAFLLVHPVRPDQPESILQEDTYRAFSKLKRRIAEQVNA